MNTNLTVSYVSAKSLTKNYMSQENVLIQDLEFGDSSMIEEIAEAMREMIVRHAIQNKEKMAGKVSF